MLYKKNCTLSIKKYSKRNLSQDSPASWSHSRSRDDPSVKDRSLVCAVLLLELFTSPEGEQQKKNSVQHAQCLYAI